MKTPGLELFVIYRTLLGVVAAGYMMCGLIRGIRTFKRLPPHFKTLIVKGALRRRYLIHLIEVLVLVVVLALLIYVQFRVR